MNPETASPQPDQATPPGNYKSRKTSLKKILWLPVLLALVAIAAFGGYYYANLNDESKSSDPKAANTENKAISSEAHYILSDGYPYDLGAKKKVMVKLAVPASIQAVRVSSHNFNRGMEQYFTDKYNDELARFALGYPENERENGGGVSELSILAIGNSWRRSTTDLDAWGILGPDEFINTPAQKEQYLKKLNDETAACVKDSAKGFKTSGLSFNVCYDLSFGKEGYSPYMALRGYSELDGVPLILFGQINPYDNTEFSSREEEFQAISDAREGRYTSKAKRAIDDILSALPKTEVVVTDHNPN